ncbi:MAG TPA: hypothetical protein ENI23_00945 [bacterium]|nr:hypothetical protein [bacterium]
MAQKIFTAIGTGGNIDLGDGAIGWTNVRNAAVGQGIGVGAYQIAAVRDGNYYQIRRIAVGWDTSVLNNIAKSIDGFTIRVDLGSLGGNPDVCSVHVVETTWDSANNIVLANYNDLTFASKGSETFANIGTDTDIVVSDPAIVNPTGKTEVFLISNRDLNNQAPSDVEPDNEISLQNIKAIVDYTPKPSGSLLLNFL